MGTAQRLLAAPLLSSRHSSETAACTVLKLGSKWPCRVLGFGAPAAVRCTHDGPAAQSDREHFAGPVRTAQGGTGGSGGRSNVGSCSVLHQIVGTIQCAPLAIGLLALRGVAVSRGRRTHARTHGCQHEGPERGASRGCPTRAARTHSTCFLPHHSR